MEAYKLRQSGLANAEIVKRKLGFRTAADVSKAIHGRIESEARQVAALERETMLAMENARLDALQSAFWELAVGGSLEDAKFVLSVMEKRWKLNQMDVPDARTVGQTVLVVRGDSEADYVGSLGGQLPENEDEEA